MFNRNLRAAEFILLHFVFFGPEWLRGRSEDLFVQPEYRVGTEDEHLVRGRLPPGVSWVILPNELCQASDVQEQSWPDDMVKAESVKAGRRAGRE